MKIEIPASIGASVDDWSSPGGVFIVISFGSIEIGRWRWDGVGDPDEWEVERFVAEKMRAVFFPKKKEFA